MYEPFHRQDFFFINYAYQNNYNALSSKYNHLITIHENECYVGQPYSGYALRGKSDHAIVIMGILIRKETFFKEYLPIIYEDAELFRFFLNPKTNQFSDEFIHLSSANDHPIRTLLELMVLEYADKKDDTQKILKSMLQTLLLEIVRLYRIENMELTAPTLTERIISYIDNHSDIVTLKDIADDFGYHPNYISTLLHKNAGKTFTEMILEKRMERAVLLMQNTTLSIEEIASMLGYTNHSNFYKAFKKYFHKTPREYIKKDNDMKKQHFSVVFL